MPIRLPVLRAVGRIPGARATWRRLKGLQAAVRLAADSEQARAYRDGRRGKPTWQRVADNVLWAVRYGRPTDRYYAYGMETKAGPDYAQYHFAEEVMRGFNRQIEADEASRAAAVLRDKYFFSLVAQALGHPSPRPLALMGPSRVDLLAPRRSLSYEAFVSEGLSIDGFAKGVSGAHGTGAFSLRVEEGRAWIDGEPAEPAAVAERVAGRYLLQERIEQHSTLAALHPPSLNTVRLITVLAGERAEPVTAALRFGVGGAPIDNMSAGGGVVGVNLESGTASGKALFMPGARGKGQTPLLDQHPDTGVPFRGYALPYFPEALDLACRFHLDMGGPQSIGWDVAFTPSGPCIVEGNSHWAPPVHVALDPCFTERFVRAAGGAGGALRA